jgi:putative GTP pyrophosphokinase
VTKEISKSQIDRLGDRLKKGNIGEDDLRLLDQYRRSFTEAYEIVVGTIRQELGLEPTGRPAKSTTSISEKLQRESIRLTQIQDIAGCRLVVTDIARQEQVIQSLRGLFEHTTVCDRRQAPSHGYRAVHVIAHCRGKLIEIQVRTALQHTWAELSEKFSDIHGAAIKYGGGNEEVRKILMEESSLIGRVESLETGFVEIKTKWSSRGSVSADEEKIAIALSQSISSLREDIFNRLRDHIDAVENLKGENNAVSN